jgi:Zn-finger nucleic acid-binding protein
MESLDLEGQAGTTVQIDVCALCQVFWFDRHESLKLAPASTLRVFTRIGEASASGRTPISSLLKCPRCHAHLSLTHDQQRNTPFEYWRCPHDHGRLITFFQFLREKDFIRPLSQAQLVELRRNVQSVNCSNCGASIDLAKESVCAHCGTALSMLDLDQAKDIVAQLKRAAEPRPVDPTLPLRLVQAKREAEAAFPADGRSWSDAASSGLVEAAFGALMALVKKTS